MGDGARALAKALHQHPSMLCLDLSHNRIQDAGARAFSEMLLNNSTLTTLFLANNGIGSKGLRALGEALMSNVKDGRGINTTINSTLQYLTLWGNNFDAKATEVWNSVITGDQPRIQPGDIDVTFYRPSTSNTKTDAQPTTNLEAAQSPCVSIGCGPGSLRKSKKPNEKLVPLQHANMWVGRVDGVTTSEIQRTLLEDVATRNKPIEQTSQEQLIYEPWRILNGLAGLVGVAASTQLFELRPVTPDVETEIMGRQSEGKAKVEYTEKDSTGNTVPQSRELSGQAV